MNGVGGVGVLLAHEGSTGRITEINFYGRTPANLRADVFVPYLGPPKSAHLQSSFGWRSVQDDLHERGFLSVGVPTYAAGLAELHHRFGIQHATIQIELADTDEVCALTPEHVV